MVGKCRNLVCEKKDCMAYSTSCGRENRGGLFRAVQFDDLDEPRPRATEGAFHNRCNHTGGRCALKRAFAGERFNRALDGGSSAAGGADPT